jgi:hypothetical protein
MKVRCCVLLVGTLLLFASACGDGGPSILTHQSHSLVLFKRVTLAAESPDRAEIEIEVRTGAEYSQPAPDGTQVVVETSLGEFEGNGPRIETETVGGRTVVTLVLPGAAHLTVTAIVDNVESELGLIVDGRGSLQLRKL